MTKIAHVPSLYASEPGKPHVFIATPVQSGAPSSVYTFSLVQNLQSLQAAGIAADHCLMAGNCHVDDARNGFLPLFMATDCSDLLFWDADVGCAPTAIADILRYDRDVVAGVYPKKTDEVEFPVEFDRTQPLLQAAADGLIEVAGAPTGFMRIRRHVVEKMLEANKHRQFAAQRQKPDEPLQTIVFERTYEAGFRRSGDYAFCHAWRKLGGQVFVAPEMAFAHEGQKEWVGVLGDWLRERAGLDHPAFATAMLKLRAGEPDAETLVDLMRGWDNPWAATPELLLACYLHAAAADGPILETGSGLSTLVMAAAAARAGHEVHALEHDRDWYEKTKRAIERYRLSNVRLHWAPLEEYAGFLWYSLPLTLPERFALVLCDGPPRRYGRHGLFALLGEAIAGADVLADDAADEALLAPLRRWAAARARDVTVMGNERRFALSPRRNRAVAVAC